MASASHTALRKAAAFDPGERVSEEVLNEEIRLLTAHPLMGAVLDASGAGMLVVNRQLQIVAANHIVLGQLDAPSVTSLLGRRIGEVFKCTNSVDADHDCGSSEWCQFCGHLDTILRSQAERRVVVGESALRMSGGAKEMAAEFRVTATPLELNGHFFTVVAMQDIGDEKRRAVLERLFVHDLKNSLQGIIGWSQLLAENPTNDTEKLAHRISALTRLLAEEIETHRLLLAAESGLLKPRLEPILPMDALSELKSLFAHHREAYAKAIRLVEPVAEAAVMTDGAILRRVLVNMIVNALEATEQHGEVRLGCEADDGVYRFQVWNAGKMSDEAAANIYKRSYSTKAPTGRGIGTYSMKLFGEGILSGKVYFTSDDTNGTSFFLELPVNGTRMHLR
jgi:signal transduction histidine kinase